MVKKSETSSKKKSSPTPFRDNKNNAAICGCCGKSLPVKTRLSLENQTPSQKLAPLIFEDNDTIYEVLPQFVTCDNVTESGQEFYCWCGATFKSVLVLKVKDINILVLM